ncbi:MAG: aminodeoxychorismate synthase component I [Cytophagaceae bacterium SCN 52-12]|nr:MAG: aminodeoxychorismate synthase component I [Cytophagaceae bacterium SCN 52-12]
MALHGKTPFEPSFAQFCDRMDRLGAQQVPFVFVIDYKCRKPLIWEVGDVPPGVLYDFSGFTNQPAEASPAGPAPVFRKYPMPFDEYMKSFELAQKNIRRGESFLVNISARTPVETNLSLKEIFLRSSAAYKLCLEDQFVCFSPETFVRICRDEIATYPMKGTIDASLPDAARSVLQNPKEAAEHATIVDLLRNDISRAASKVWVEKYRYIDTIRTLSNTLLQVSSEIRGKIPASLQNAFGSILYEMLPAGSVTGAPKPRTIQIIEEAEGYDRGYYTGVMGCFDGVRFESAVMIRFIERIGGGLVFKSGGGITGLSDAGAEYQEMIDKVYLPIPASPAEY